MLIVLPVVDTTPPNAPMVATTIFPILLNEHWTFPVNAPLIGQFVMNSLDGSIEAIEVPAGT
jgi:hypothetical protein